jgi:hypothetical protein
MVRDGKRDKMKLDEFVAAVETAKNPYGNRSLLSGVAIGLFGALAVLTARMLLLCWRLTM